MTKEYRLHNKQAWERKTALHLKEEGLYTPRVERLLQGDIEAAEDTPDVLEDIKGARLLHLQCHIGLDSFIEAGLSIEYLHEFPLCFYNMFYEHPEEILIELDGKWFLSKETPETPLSFSLKVRK